MRNNRGRRQRSRPMAATVAALALAGCTGDSQDGALPALSDPEVTFLSEGVGPTNELSLEPMITGARAALHRTEGLHWLGEVDAGRDTVSILAQEGTWGDETSLFRKMRDGVVLQGVSYPLDPERASRLWLPDTVRVGMEWTSTLESGFVERRKVLARTEMVLSTGPAVVWTIDTGFAGDDNLGGTLGYYAEGLGTVALQVPSGSLWNDIAFADTVVPEDPQTHEELGLDPVALKPILDPFGSVFDVHANYLLATSGAVRDGQLWIYTHGDVGNGEQMNQCIALGPIPRRVNGGDDPACPYLEQQLDYGVRPTTIWSSSSLIPGSTQLLPVSDAEGRSDGVILYAWTTPAGLRCMTYFNRNRARDFAIHDDPSLCEGDGVEFEDATGAANAYRGGQDYMDMQFFGPTFVEDPSAPLHLGFIDPSGQIFRLSVVDGRVEGPTPAGLLPGIRSEFVTDVQRDVYSITGDGRVFRATIDAGSGDIAVESLGDVLVEDDSGFYVFAGVTPDPDVPGDVIVGVDVYWFDLDGDGVTDPPRYNQGLYRASLTRDPIPAVFPASFGVGAADVNGGIAVCWPPSDEPLERDGWSVAGKPARFVTEAGGPNGSCAVIVPDGGPAPGWEGAEHAVSGPVPGVGRVRIGYGGSPFAGHGIDPATAVLRDGTAVSLNGVVIDAAGLETSSVDSMRGSGSVGLAVSVDLGGYGLWAEDTASGRVDNVGGGVEVPTCPWTDSWALCHNVGGVITGGFLYAAADPAWWKVVRPNGVDDVPLVQAEAVRAAGISRLTVLEDGRICGVMYDVVHCIASDGSRTTSTGTFFVSPAATPFIPLPDGRFAVAGNLNDSTFVFDPDAMTVAPYSDVGILAPNRAPDGAWFALSVWTPEGAQYSTAQVVRLDASGPVPISPEYAEVEDLRPWAVVPLTDHVLVNAAVRYTPAVSQWDRLVRP